MAKARLRPYLLIGAAAVAALFCVTPWGLQLDHAAYDTYFLARGEQPLRDDVIFVAIDSFEFLDNRGNRIGGGGKMTSYEISDISDYIPEHERTVTVEGQFSGTKWGLKLDCETSSTSYEDLGGSCTEKKTDQDFKYTPAGGSK